MHNTDDGRRSSRLEIAQCAEWRHNTYAGGLGVLPWQRQQVGLLAGITIFIAYAYSSTFSRCLALTSHRGTVRLLTIFCSNNGKQASRQSQHVSVFLLKFNFPRISDKFVLEMYGCACSSVLSIDRSYAFRSTTDAMLCCAVWWVHYYYYYYTRCQPNAEWDIAMHTAQGTAYSHRL